MSPICGGWWVNKQYRLEPPLQLWRCIFLFVSHTLPIRILLLTCKKIEELRVSRLFSWLYKFSCFFDCILIILITYTLFPNRFPNQVWQLFQNGFNLIVSPNLCPWGHRLWIWSEIYKNLNHEVTIMVSWFTFLFI